MPCGRRVVVTGLGLVTPIGVGVKRAWNAILNGHKNCISLANRPEFKALPSQIACVVPEGKEAGLFDPSQYSQTDWRMMSRSTAFAISAADEAMADAGFKPNACVSDDITNSFGVAIGSIMMDAEDCHNTGKLLDAERYNKISPYFVARALTNMHGGHISMRYGLRGPQHSISAACATGAMAIGDAANFIKRGAADLMLCGATDCCVSPIIMAGFCRARALSTHFNDNPSAASRPFDKQRDGFVIGEGAGIMVLEELSHAKNRGAKIYAECVGYGLSGDAYHITAPDIDGSGVQRSMKGALDDAQVKPQRVGYINAHATSTPAGDVAECAAIGRLFADGSRMKPTVSSTKGSTGHLQGAAGAVEAIFTILAVYNSLVPPSVNLSESEIVFDTFDVVSGTAKAWEWMPGVRKFALSNSSGFGGINASLAFGSLENL